MMSMLLYVYNNISIILLGLVALLSYVTYKKNKKLVVEKEALAEEVVVNKKVILAQKRVINVTKDFKANSLDDNINLMRNKKL